MKELEKFLRENLEENFRFGTCTDRVIVIICTPDLKFQITKSQGRYSILHKNMFLNNVYVDDLKVSSKEEVLEEVHRCYWALISLSKDVEDPEDFHEIVEFSKENLPKNAYIEINDSKVEITYESLQLKFVIELKENVWKKKSIHMDILKRNESIQNYQILNSIQRAIYHVYLAIDRDRKRCA